MGDNCRGNGNCGDKESDECCNHDHDHGAFAIDQLTMTNNILVNTLIDILIEKGVFKEEEFEAKLKEQGVEGYSDDKAEPEEEVEEAEPEKTPE